MSKFKYPYNYEFARRMFEFKADDDGHIVGVPIVFEQKTDICGLFEETIARGAISEDLLKDVSLFYNHDLSTKPLARTKNGRLKFSIENDGVHMTANINRERSDANDLYLAIRDGDIDGMSFMFRVESDEWQDLESDYPKRRITKISEVHEVSVVNYPAYNQTSVNARSTINSVREKNDLELAKLKARYLYKI